jgi:hypothetical protein
VVWTEIWSRAWRAIGMPGGADALEEAVVELGARIAAKGEIAG